MKSGEIEIRSLKGLSFDELYAAHLKAFKDYPFQWTKEALQRTVHRRGFSPELSYGAFHNNNLVSFTWNGIGTFEGRRTAYDTGTGTAEGYRGKGLASKIFEYSVPHLKAAGIQQYLLEVLTGNAAAQSVYLKQGFSVTRSLHCFRTESNKWEFLERPLEEGILIKKIDLDEKVMKPMIDFELSWQNSFESLSRNPGHFEVVGAFRGNELLGYGVIEPDSGDIPHLAVKKGAREKGIGAAILSALRKMNRSDTVKMINIPADCPDIIRLIIKHGLPEIAIQYEMLKEL